MYVKQSVSRPCNTLVNAAFKAIFFFHSVIQVLLIVFLNILSIGRSSLVSKLNAKGYIVIFFFYHTQLVQDI